MIDIASLLERVDTVSDLLEGEARQQARRVVAMCRDLATRQRALGKLVPEAEDLVRKRELGRLTELLGRRATHALPAAALGRAGLADLSGDLSSAEATRQDCEKKLALLGF
jgi:hypothetical protein